MFATLAGCSAFPTSESAGAETTPRGPVDPDSADQRRTLTAIPGTVSPAPNGTKNSKTWLYDEQSPGPELRVTGGDILQVDLTNRLLDPTIHRHGIPLASPTDGVPDVTRAPVEIMKPSHTPSKRLRLGRTSITAMSASNRIATLSVRSPLFALL